MDTKAFEDHFSQIEIQPTPEGTSGSYFLTKSQKKIAIFKPYDEEPFTPNNPRGYIGHLGDQGIRKGISSGEQATREVIAHRLDAQIVPATFYVQIQHPYFKHSEKKIEFCKTFCKNGKSGSLQQFVEHDDAAYNYGESMFSDESVH